MAKKRVTFSIAIAAYNEEQNLADCLSSVRDIADEIVVVDGGSTDKTVEIAKQFDARVIATDNPPVFHINKQKALDTCGSDWILQLDADETVPDDLKREIIGTISNKQKESGHGTISNKQKAINGYYLPRRNYFWGHFMKKGGQYPDYVIRLVRKGMAHFPCKSVHEQIVVEGEVGHLTHPMIHRAYKTRADYWRKANAYTTLTAEELKRNTTPKTVGSFLNFMIWKPLIIFLSLFIRHKGFVDGLWGFEFALYSGLHWAIAYRKYLRM